jgi:lipopolysaccharide/colanic/teichoic acid biosynthesis glycosyltransferase
MLVVLAPLMAAIAVAVKVESPGPVLFRQRRVGRWVKTFDMLKFRSMRQDAEQLLQDLMKENEAQGPMFKIRRDPRVTRVGRVIRRLSLDELPQLFNVLNGTMSLVGPRPPLPNEVEQYKPEHFRRLEAVPGLTGLWQVTRTDFTFDEVMFADTQYIENWSFGLDVAIMLRTIPSVLSARGAF